MPHPPAARLQAEATPEEGPVAMQHGHLIGYQWLMDGAPAEATPWDPIAWPTPTMLPSRHVVLAIETPMPPVRIGLSLKRDPHGGVGLDAIEWDCGQPGWEAMGGTRPDCLIEQGADGTAVLVPFELPASSHDWYIAVEAVWLLPPDTPGAKELPIRQAWWSFAVNVAS